MILPTFITPQYLTSEEGFRSLEEARHIVANSTADKSELRWAGTVLKVAESSEYKKHVASISNTSSCKCHPNVNWRRYGFRENGYVYLLESAGFYKIGFSKSPFQRVHSLHKSTPLGVRVIHCFPSWGPIGQELVLHDKYRDKRVHGEWFALDESDIEDIKAR